MKGVGFVISDSRIITRAQYVNHAATVKVKKRNCEEKFIAQIVEIGHECLAVLSVNDKAFWRALQPLELGNDLGLQGQLLFIEYEENRMCLTRGLLTRMFMTEYEQANGLLPLLTAQVSLETQGAKKGRGLALDSHSRVVGIAIHSSEPNDDK